MGALEAVSSNDLLNLIIYDTLSNFGSNNNNNNNASSSGINFPEIIDNPLMKNGGLLLDKVAESSCSQKKQNLGVRRKRRRRPKVCKNKEEAETQRMTHIAVERNRRKQMNDHLAVLRSLMPQSYVQRGDQASIVGGAIDYVKELEHMLQNLEAQKFQLQRRRQQRGGGGGTTKEATSSSSSSRPGAMEKAASSSSSPPPFSQFFAYPQYSWSELPSTAEIEVTLIETHASVRILGRRRVRQLSSMVAAFHTLYLTILHLNVTTLHPFVLYSLSAKVEEGCQFKSADDIAGAVHHILRIIEDEAAAVSNSQA